MIRDAGLLNYSLSGMPMAWFSEENDCTESLTTILFRTLEEAEGEIHIFENREIYEELAKK